MKFSEKIYLLRKEAGMTQSELSEALHVSRQSISKWEMGTAMPDMVNIIAISKIFLVSIDYLIHDDIEVRESQKKINLPSHNKEICDRFFLYLSLTGSPFLGNPSKCCWNYDTFSSYSRNGIINYFYYPSDYESFEI